MRARAWVDGLADEADESSGDKGVRFELIAMIACFQS
jgi:hypothetical protein